MRRLLWIVLVAGCATGDAEDEVIRVEPDVGVLPDLGGVNDSGVGTPDAEMDATRPDLGMADAAADLDAAADVSMPPCNDACGAAEVCRDDQCVDICQTNAAECGVTELDGKQVDCGMCSAGAVCATNQCVDICGPQAVSCGQAFLDGLGADCGTCATGSCETGVCATGPWREVDAGYRHTCARKDDGGVWCWGKHDRGELGLGGATSPVTSPTKVTGVAGATTLATVNQHTCASSGTSSWCFGANDLAQLGNAQQTDAASPVTLNPGNVRKFATGGAHTCALMTDGTVKCWGANGQGQCGKGDFAEPVLQPTTLAGLTDVVDISAGLIHTCAVRNNGEVLCWGYNDRGQISGTRAASNRALRVVGVDDAVRVVTGNYHSCAVTAAGAVKCWGDGAEGQLGDGAGALSRTPVTANVTNVRSLAAGRSHTCAVRRSNDVYCWGANNEGQLGDGSVSSKIQPVRVSTLSGVLGVTAGFEHTCAVGLTGNLWCWGQNLFGQVGDGTTSNRQINPKLVP